MEKRRVMRTSSMVTASFLFCILASSVLSAQTLTTLVTFNGFNGREPGALVLGSDGNLFGTTDQDGIQLGGTVFGITPDGAFIAQNGFNGNEPENGEYPTGLMQAENGNFYGTTYSGGNTKGGGAGTVFEIGHGKLTTLYRFCSQPKCADGADPTSGVIQAKDGNFYGTTSEGGAGRCSILSGCGTVFEITPDGQYNVIYNFCSLANCTDGGFPDAGLIQGSDGNFYGTTFYGGNTGCGGYGCGTIFKLTAAGQLTTLHVFCSQGHCTDGALPSAGLVQGRDGNFYGTAEQGGAPSSLCLSNAFGCGTVFRITPSGEFTTLHIFCSTTNCTDGDAPVAPLIQAADGNFYGTTYFGGANGLYVGTVFQVTPSGKLTTLYSFCSETGCADGGSPGAGLVQAIDGKFYGTTSGSGGDDGYGTVFSLAIGQGSDR